MNGGTDILFVAGEHSGDQHAALLLRKMRQKLPDLRVAALGGPALAAEGADMVEDLTAHSVVGLVEVLKHYGYFRKVFAKALQWIRLHQPKVVCLVDYPGFNLRLAQELSKEGISRKGGGNVAVYQYISPQIWAWKSSRRFKMAECLDELGVIFPFEVDCYRDTVLPVHFVGHPFVEPDADSPVSYGADGVVLLLPGSRRQAVQRIFPIMLRTWKAMQEKNPGRVAVAIFPDRALGELLQSIVAGAGLTGSVKLHPAGKPVAARAVLTSSGTMSLQCALAGIPGAIVYRAHPWTYWLGRRLVKIPYLGMANILLQRPAYPEFLQAEAEPGHLATIVERILVSGDAAANAARDAEELSGLLRVHGGAGAADRLLTYIPRASAEC